MSIKSSHRSATSSTTSVSDVDIIAIANETKRKVHWDRILRDTNMQWKWQENARAFSIYTSRDAAIGFSVLAIGVVKGTLHEVESLLSTSTQEQFEQLMKGTHEKDFKHGQIIGESIVQDDRLASGDHTVLSQRSATFSSSGWLKSDCKWNFVEATTYNGTEQVFQRQLTTGPMTSAKSSRKFREAVELRNVICCYRAVPERGDNGKDSDQPTSKPSSTPKGKQQQSTRVHFFGQFVPPSQSRTGRSLLQASDIKLAEQRLLQFAKSCGRLSVLIRRRRLGHQVLVNPRVVASLTKPECLNCGQRQASNKTCQLCGQCACDDCAAKHERERRGPRGTVVIDFVRVCDPCLHRVEAADYALAFRQAPKTPALQRDAPGAPDASADLKDLLRDALLDASSSRKPSVMKVIRYVLDQEEAETPANEPPRKRSVTLTPQSADAEYVNALDSLEVNKEENPQLAEAEGRSYVLAASKDPEEVRPYPVPSNEPKRTQAIEASGILDSGMCTELNIICDMAAKELNTAVSLVTISVGGEQVVVGSNRPEYANNRRPREDSFCQHTVMSSKPLIVPHPEADIRFSTIKPLTQTGARFYAGFPVTTHDESEDVVLGTLCCVDTKSHELTESQYAAMQKLSETAAKVIKLQGRRRRSATTTAQPATVPE